ncbi:MAG TPA: alpha/beta hydrolase, partial [Caulobacteraceae bacterium]|nr:alpha/beta hydrolase [Caulobacteraceae bacterium]
MRRVCGFAGSLVAGAGRPRAALVILALLAALSLAGHARSQPQQASPAASGPRLEAAAFVSSDGARLPLQQWGPRVGEPWAVIVGVHGMNDDSNAFELAGPYWARDGILTIAYDQRGFGRSPRHGVWVGDAVLVEDLRTLISLVRARYPHAILAVAG